MAHRYDHVFTSAHAELLRAAYVTLAGTGDKQKRWSQAHRVVRAALPWDGRQSGSEEQAYRFLLVRVIRRAIKPGWLIHVPSLPKAATPAGGPHQRTVDHALAQAGAAVRAAFYLLIAEQRAPAQVQAILRECGVDHAPAAVREGMRLSASLRQNQAIDAAEQRSALLSAAMTPKAAWLPAPAPLQVRANRITRYAIAAGAAGMLAAGAALAANPAPQHSFQSTFAAPVSKVDADVWQRAGRVSLHVWPTRGTLTGDSELVGAAVRASRFSAPRLLYAGMVANAPVILLSDGYQIARYTAGQPVEFLPLASDDVYGTAVLRLADGYFLTAPWVSALHAGPIGSTLRQVSINDGVAGPLHPAEGCQKVSVLKVTTAGMAPAQSFTLGDTGNGHPAHLMYLPPVIAGQVQRPHEQDAIGGPDAFAAAGCHLAPMTAKPLRSLTVWEFARFPLPDGTQGRWICARADRIDGGSDVSLMIAGPTPAAAKVVITGPGDRWCSRQEQHLAAAGWWQGERGWYLFAAGSRAVDQLAVAVGSRRVTGRGPLALGPYQSIQDGATIAAFRSGQPVPVLAGVSVASQP